MPEYQYNNSVNVVIKNTTPIMQLETPETNLIYNSLSNIISENVIYIIINNM